MNGLGFRALGALAAVAALGCGEATDALGSVMLAISTDMYVDKDVSRVDIVVQPARGPLQSTQINLFPELEGQFLPGTFSIIEGSEPGELVRVRVIARQDSRVRVVREAALKVPRQRTALLSMPIQWLCDGQVRQEGQLHRSDCDDGFTCISGSCQPEEIDETTLPDYEIQDVFGGGDATGGGSCFDTLECFRTTMEPVLNVDTCRFSVPGEDHLNVAVVLPPGASGHCTSSECWIPLDRSPLTGWFVDEATGEVQLPVAICERARASGARVLTSRDCASKAPSTPTCGPWTLVGTAPGTDVNTPNPSDPALDEALVAELTRTSQRLASEVAGACASVAGVSPPAEPSAADVTALCEAARLALGTVVPLTWHHIPTRCWPDHAGQLECERSCDASCDPGTLEQRCVTGGLAGACSASCDSRVCLAAEGVPVPCAGGCVGSCAGACEGNCLGACDGVCSNPSPDGYCDGTCAGTCAGLCQGRCQGTCEGRCDGDPGAAAAPCAAGSQCVGGCAGGFEGATTCDSPLGSGACALEPGCQGNCQVMATFKVQCERPTAWVLPKPGLDAAVHQTLVEVLPLLVNVRDAKALVVLDEATRLLARMRSNSATPEAQLSQVDSATSMLGTLTSTTTNLLLAVGQERSSFVQGPGGVPAGTCEPVSAGGSAPLIDDFEDGDALVLRNDGRDGAWHVSHDGTGQLNLAEPPIPELGGANGSTRAMHLSGSGFTGWGAGLTVDLREGGRPYDASLHQGISFWVRGSNRLRFALIQANLSPAQACGGGCTLATECGLFYTTELTITDVWTQVFVPWTQLTRDFQGGVSVGPEQLLSVRFEGPASDVVDLWLDDVAFY